MRTLTIKRTKSFVACLGKMKVYIEDSSSSEIVINDVPCRKLGVLKNGEEKQFTIDEKEAKVFVIADKVSKDFCNDFYQIPAGDEDVYLSGKNNFNPANGNAFRFDGVEDETILKNRKKGTKMGLIVLIAAIIGGGILGIGIGGMIVSDANAKEKVFSTSGMEITLNTSFSEQDVEGFTQCYGSQNIAVFVIKEDFTLLEGFQDYSIEEYGNLVIENSGLSDEVQLKQQDGLTYFEFQYTNPEDNTAYDYLGMVYKGPDAFWLIQFAVTEENAEKYREQIFEWAQSVRWIEDIK